MKGCHDQCSCCCQCYWFKEESAITLWRIFSASKMDVADFVEFFRRTTRSHTIIMYIWWIAVTHVVCSVKLICCHIPGPSFFYTFGRKTWNTTLSHSWRISWTLLLSRNSHNPQMLLFSPLCPPHQKNSLPSLQPFLTHGWRKTAQNPWSSVISPYPQLSGRRETKVPQRPSAHPRVELRKEKHKSGVDYPQVVSLHQCISRLIYILPFFVFLSAMFSTLDDVSCCKEKYLFYNWKKLWISTSSMQMIGQEELHTRDKTIVFSALYLPLCIFVMWKLHIVYLQPGRIQVQKKQLKKPVIQTATCAALAGRNVTLLQLNIKFYASTEVEIYMTYKSGGWSAFNFIVKQHIPQCSGVSLVETFWKDFACGLTFET